MGDGKQSIYRFRGADVSVFRQEQRDIRARGQAYDLSTSYRGHRALIEALNALLEPVLGSDEDAARPYVEPFSPIDALSAGAAATTCSAPYVELHLALGSKSDGRAGDRGRGRWWRGWSSWSKATPSWTMTTWPCSAGRRAPFRPTSARFEEAGVPFVTVAGRGFYERPEVRDLLNALQALDDPTDDLALAGLLRSPACGLSDMALLRLVDLRRERELPSLWDALCLRARATMRDARTVPPGRGSGAGRARLRPDRRPARAGGPGAGGRRAQGLSGRDRLSRALLARAARRAGRAT